MPLWGLKLRGSEDSLIQTWEPTYDPEDMTAHESVYAPGDTVDAAYEFLSKRLNLTPPGHNNTDHTAVKRIWRQGDRVYVSKYPMIEPDWRWKPDIAAITSEVIANGKLVIGGSYAATGYRTLIEDDDYHGSDLVCARSDDGDYAIRYDPDRAKARRSRRGNMKVRQDFQVKKQSVQQERDARIRAVHDQMDVMYATVQSVTADLAARIPQITTCVGDADDVKSRFGARYGLPGDNKYYYWSYSSPGSELDSFEDFWFVVDLRARLVPANRRNGWRKNPKLADALDRVYKMVDRFGDETCDRWAEHRAAKTGAGERSRAALTRFLTLVVEHRRKRRRKPKTAAVPAKVPA